MRLFQFTEGTYYSLITVDLVGDADSAPTKPEEAVRGGADLIVVTHPHVRTLMTRDLGRPVVFGILGDPLVLGAGDRAEIGTGPA